MYCNQTGLNCENANSYGNCLITACIKPINTVAVLPIAAAAAPPIQRVAVLPISNLYNEQINTVYPVQTQESDISISTFTRRCEICDCSVSCANESETEDINHHICARCRLKLHDLLYNDPEWGKGNWA